MPLTAGTRLGAYEVLAPLGAGGMGEVYRAKDSRLGREVALKILPPAFARDPERLRRFEQEARAVSALNHPNIVSVYDVGCEGSTYYLVMELVEGKTVRELLSTGALPLKKTLQIAAQAAEGLARTHEAGLVHRDLKPENLMVTRDSRVKILDFGLAKQVAAGAGSSAGGWELLTAASLATSPGVVLGTVSYMSPEQAQGQAADFRSDQFSLGSVLYEMVTGKSPFQRQSAPQTMSAIIEDEPEPVAALNPKTPAPLRWIVERCLAKEPEHRYAATFDLARDLANVRDHLSETAASGPEPAAAPRTPVRARRLRPFLWAALGALAATLVFLLARSQAPEPPALRTLTFSGSDTSPAVAPDGRAIAFASRRDGTSRIWLKQLVGGGEVPLTAGPDDVPRFSPDGAMVLFARDEGAQASIYRVPTLGGEPRKLVDNALEADWSPDGRQIVFLRLKSEQDRTTSIIGIATADGEGAREIQSLPNQLVAGPRWSPDGHTIALYSNPVGVGGSADIGIFLISLDGKELRRMKPAMEGGGISSLAWSGSGRALLYARSVSAASMGDLTTGSARIILQQIGSQKAQTLFWLPAQTFTVEVMGPGSLLLEARSIRQNLREVTLGPKGAPAAARWLTRGASSDRQPIYSPDGEWLAFASNRSGNLDIWALSTKTGSLRRLTDNEADDWDPGFSPDGKRIIFSSRRSGNFEIWLADADGSGARQVSHDGVDAENPTMAANGWIVYNSGNPEKRGLWKVRSDGSEAKRVVEGMTSWPEISTSGEYAVYTTNAEYAASTAIRAVRVVRLSDGSTAGEIRVQGGGGGRARWMPGGRAIAFADKDGKGLLGVFVQDFVPGTDTSASRRPLAGFDPEVGAESFAITHDGSRLALATLESSQSLMIAEGIAGVSRPRRAGR